MKSIYIKITALFLLVISCLFAASCSDIKSSDNNTVKALENSEQPTASQSESVSQVDDIPLRDDYMTVGHRGYSGEYPESTVEAFKGAFKKGFDAVECDVWETYAGSFLVQHDPTTTRTTGKANYIWRLNKKSRYNYPIKYSVNVKKYKNKKLIIPSLEEVLQVVKDNKGYLFLHIKNNSKYLLSEEGVNKIMMMLHDYGLQDKTLIFGGKEFVKPFTNLGFKTGLFAAPKNRKQFTEMADWCEKNNVNTLVLANKRAMRAYQYDKGIAKYLKGKKLDFGLYKAATIKQADYFRSIGAWFSMSDNYVK